MNIVPIALFKWFLYLAPTLSLFKASCDWGPVGLVFVSGATGIMAAFSKMLKIPWIGRILVCEMSVLWFMGKMAYSWPIRMLMLSLLFFLTVRFYVLLQLSPSHFKWLGVAPDHSEF